MAGTQVDRINGLVGNQGVKTPCKVASTGPLTLAGEQTIDGVACVTGDRVLVKDQTNGAENGIYAVNALTWAREPDWDGPNDITQGTEVVIAQGTVNTGATYRVTSAPPITIGTTVLTFTLSPAATQLGFTQAGTGAVNISVQAKLRESLSLKDFGAVGDGVANDTVPLTNFLAACAAQNKRGYVPAGTYLVDAFSFTTDHAGLVLYGDSYGRTGARPGVPAGAGVFGLTPTLFRCRTATAAFCTINGAYDLNISNISLDGNGIADSVLYYPGTANNTHTHWSGSFFMRPTPTTGYVHYYAGSNGGEACTFFQCNLRGGNFPADGTHAAACVKNTNTNAFVGKYDNCIFQTANYLIYYGAGSAHLIDCEFYEQITAAILVESITQAFDVINAYTEGAPNVPFLVQAGVAGVTSNRPITFVNPTLNAPNSHLNLNCQQPVYIYGGYIGASNIAVNPMATYGAMSNIVEGVAFNLGYGITGTGATTRVTTRGNHVLDAGVDTVYPSNFPNGITSQTIAVGLGAGGVSTNTAIGASALISNTTGLQNTCTGYSSGLNITTGSWNTCYGAAIMDQSAGVTGGQNVAIGRIIARPLTSGSLNTLVGDAAGNGLTTGSNNTLIGGLAGSTLTTGSNNTYVGEATACSAVGVSSEIVVGVGLTGKGTQTAFIGGTSGAYNGANVTTWAVTSDRRIKKNIKAVSGGLETILALKPVEFDYIQTNKHDIGFIAQDYQQILPEQVKLRAADAFEKELLGENQILSIHQNLVPYLVNAIQELKKELEEIKVKVN